MVGLIGKKAGMTRIFLEDGTNIPVTVIEVPKNYVVMHKTKEKDGYNAIVVGAYEQKEHRVDKPLLGIFKKNNVKVLKYLKEFKVDSLENFPIGKEISVEEIFSPGEVVDILGKSKGRGFTGTMKRWDFGGFPKSHGHRYHRAVGSVGNRTDPGRVWKGKLMAGRHGNETIKVQALIVVDVLPQYNALIVKGSVPGHKNGLVYIEKSKISSRRKIIRKINRLSYIPKTLLKVGE